MAEPLELANRHDAAFNAQDAEARLAIEAPDLEVIMPGGLRLHGPEQVMEVVKGFWTALPDCKILAENQFVAGDAVFAEGTLTGTHNGVFWSPNGEIPPTGNDVVLRYATVKRFRDDRLVSEHLYFDQLEFLQQIDALQP